MKQVASKLSYIQVRAVHATPPSTPVVPFRSQMDGVPSRPQAEQKAIPIHYGIAMLLKKKMDTDEMEARWTTENVCRWAPGAEAEVGDASEAAWAGCLPVVAPHV
jgi:hypothetical protein